jgi:hypothetical protein
MRAYASARSSAWTTWSRRPAGSGTTGSGVLEDARGAHARDDETRPGLRVVEQRLDRGLVLGVRRTRHAADGVLLHDGRVARVARVRGGGVGADRRRGDEVLHPGAARGLDDPARALDVDAAQVAPVVARLDRPREVHHDVRAR